MYISQLCLTNFRGFKEETKINLTSGINVFVGTNNAGKTAIITALELLFSNNVSKRLSIDDFNHFTNITQLKYEPPKIIISAKLIESDDEVEYSED